jgi:hypothetical protein
MSWVNWVSRIIVNIMIRTMILIRKRRRQLSWIPHLIILISTRLIRITINYNPTIRRRWRNIRLTNPHRRIDIFIVIRPWIITPIKILILNINIRSIWSISFFIIVIFLILLPFSNLLLLLFQYILSIFLFTLTVGWWISIDNDIDFDFSCLCVVVYFNRFIRLLWWWVVFWGVVIMIVNLYWDWLLIRGLNNLVSFCGIRVLGFMNLWVIWIGGHAWNWVGVDIILGNKIMIFIMSLKISLSSNLRKILIFDFLCSCYCLYL